ncbi:MAG: 16S rRNA (uracil(1498)-N(3))-methyltransferase [Alphaproteobacteria bacterium]|nr:16S rRNA (uracil(1498)-N(3))-methyltransferase [Alphaproteobacteria bacterium]
MRHAKLAKHRGPRVYVERRLAASTTVELDAGQAHYLRSVLRLGRGAAVAGFNAADGEWLCRIAQADKRRMSLTVEHQLRVPEPDADLWLLFAPIKRARLDWLVEKATELGVTTLLPVWTARTQSERLNLERLRAHVIEAAEQCERLSVPALHPPEALDRVLAAWPTERHLLVCDESGAGEPIANGVRRLTATPVAFLVGPEGGFDQTELDALGKLSFVTRIGLGPRVLRAETAAIAALAVFQAIAGDWRRTRTR